MPAKPIFISGTGSHVGKSWVATAICRYLHRMGHRVAPFKAQNMSNNSMVCMDDGEIGRAQAAQAEACGLEPTVDMNPILLKPIGDMASQVVLNGKPWRNLSAAEYYENFDFMLDHVLASYRRLAEQFEYVVIEGAGSVTELNLKNCDLVNLGLARRLNAPSILVADIDRGGVFASIAGTFHLLDRDESALVPTFLVNRFRGDPALFEDGVRILEEKTGKACLGVFPFAGDIYLDAEDSLSLSDLMEESNVVASRVAIVRLPHISNFTDFRLIPNAVYLSRPPKDHFDVIFIPGTKNTIDDMAWLRLEGFECWLNAEIRRGSKVIGICGGFQMLGRRIDDPLGVESTMRSIEGLGLLPIETTLAAEKTTRRVSARTSRTASFTAYEIHMGTSRIIEDLPPFAIKDDGSTDGLRTSKVIGTYLHGAFENEALLEEILGATFQKKSSSKESQYDAMADWFAKHVREDLFDELYLR